VFLGGFFLILLSKNDLIIVQTNIHTMNGHKLFKINQDAVIKNNDGEALILKQNGKWKLPGGRLEDHETPQEGLLREIREETGIGQCDIGQVLDVRLSKSGETYRATFACSTSEKLIALSAEHTEYAWINREDMDNYFFEFEETKEILRGVLS